VTPKSSNSIAVPPPPAEPEAAAGKVKKSKLQLKIEAEKKKREEMEKAEAKASLTAATAAASAPTQASTPAPTVETSTPDIDEDDGEELDEEGELEDPEETKASTGKNAAVDDSAMYATMYGDDVFDEHSIPNGGDAAAEGGSAVKGKKDRLSNKDRRRLAKEAEAKEREDEYQRVLMKKSIEGAQFAVSQTVVNESDPMWQNSLDVVIPNFSISAHNKELFLNAELNISQGRRYGVGELFATVPNQYFSFLLKTNKFLVFK
jgi:ATP-binding cassette subfamily F protein 1